MQPVGMRENAVQRLDHVTLFGIGEIEPCQTRRLAHHRQCHTASPALLNASPQQPREEGRGEPVAEQYARNRRRLVVSSFMFLLLAIG